MSDTKTAVTAALQQLAAALRSAGLYPEGHPAIHTPLRHLASGVASLLAGRAHLTLGLVDDVLVFDEIPFYDARERFRAVVAALEERELDAVVLEAGVTLTELEGLVRVLLPKGPHAAESVADALKHYDLPHVRLREDLGEGDDPRARARATYHESLGIVVDLVSEVRMGRIPTGAGATRVIDSMGDIILSDESALLGLTLLKNYDQYTYGHSVDVAIFSLAFAKFLGVDGATLRKVGLAGLLHDMGKVRMAESIIKKPGALTDEEMRQMKRHPELGVEILRQMQSIDGETVDIVHHHHIRYDGSGYPQLPAGVEVHPHGVVVALADCYDALTTTRPYQKSRHPSEAIRVMRRLSGRAYAPETFESFSNMLGTWPVGELVRLSTNELAVVASLNQVDATLPRVRIISNADGRRLAEPVDCDLADEPEGSRLVVAACDPLVKGVDVAKVLGL